MIKKLRRRIILVNMLLVGIVILMIFAVVCVNSYSNAEQELERGARCLQCFKMRLLRAARKASELGFGVFTTTLASSRWKSLTQINEAGHWAAALVSEETGKIVRFDDRNWRKGGLQQRRNELLKENGFYNQLYCRCEFSLEAMKQKFGVEDIHELDPK